MRPRRSLKHHPAPEPVIGLAATFIRIDQQTGCNKGSLCLALLQEMAFQGIAAVRRKADLEPADRLFRQPAFPQIGQGSAAFGSKQALGIPVRSLFKNIALVGSLS